MPRGSKYEHGGVPVNQLVDNIRVVPKWENFCSSLVVPSAKLGGTSVEELLNDALVEQLPLHLVVVCVTFLVVGDVVVELIKWLRMITSDILDGLT